MADKVFNDVKLSVKWKTNASEVRPDIEGEKDAQGYCNENLATTLGKVARYLKDYDAFESHGHALTDDNITGTLPISKGGTGATSASAARTELGLGTAATANTESTVANDSKLPTGSAVKTFVEGKGYVTSSGVTNVASGDGLTGGPITSTGTLKANLKDYTKSTVGVLALTNPTANTKFYPVSLDKDGKLGVSVPWTDTDTKVTSAANHYTPAKDDTATASTSVDASSSTAATWGTTALVTGVNIERDAKGHVTGLTLDSIKMPNNPNTNTTYTFAEGTTNGAFSVTPSGGSAQSVPIHGLGSAAYTASTAYAAASHNHSASNITSGTLGVARGGTGATTFTSGNVLVGNGTSAISTKAIDTTVTQSSSNLVTSGAVWKAIDNLPEPMVFKGTVGASADSPTATSLPVDGTATVGDTYKVITAGTYGGQTAKVGDTLICNSKTSSANTWVLIPSGDDVEDTWRNIKVNGTEKLGTGISTGGVDFVNGTNTTVSFNATGNKISINSSHPGITTSADTTNTGTLSHGGTFTAITAVTRDTNGHVTTLNTKTYTLPAQYSHPTYTSKTSGMYKITVDGTGHVSAATAVAASDIKGLSGIDMTAASSSAAGTHGMVPAPAKGDQAKYLRGDGTWATPTNTDTKVNVTLARNTKAYLLGTSTTPTATATAVTTVSDTGVYLDTTAGKLTATTFAGQLSGTISSGTTATTTQDSTDTSTKVATNEFVHTAALCTNDTLTINCV